MYILYKLDKLYILYKTGIHFTQVTPTDCGRSFHQNARIRNKKPIPQGLNAFILLVLRHD